MKTLNINTKIITVFLLAGALFFSCVMENPDKYGTLIITLPGSGSARAVEADGFSDDFIDNLHYVIECNGSDLPRNEFNPGEKASFSLSPGDWNITITVYNAENKAIGDYTETVTIEAGKTTKIDTINIEIEASSDNEITQFTITGPVEANVTIGNNTIVVTVPSGTEIANMEVEVEHNGYKISREPNDETLNFEENDYYTFSVQPEYGTTRVYTVTVEVEPPPEIEWPSENIWEEYDFGEGLKQPDNTTFAYLFTERDILNEEANYDMALLSSEVSASAHPLSTEGKKFLIVKILGANDAIYQDLWDSEITSKGFSRQMISNTRYYGGGPLLSGYNFRWNIFPHVIIPTSFVYQYMKRNGEIIILVVKE